jgi:pheromone shutdown-related protein TraB
MTDPATSVAYTDGPRRIIERDGTRFTLVGTAHVSRHSADEVQRLITSGDYDAIAIELCPSRHAALANPDAMAEMDLFRVIREGKVGMVAASLALGAYQQRLAEQFDIEPGAEMRVAIKAADEAGLPLQLVDREIGITLRRVYRGAPWWQRMSLLSGLLASLFSSEKITEEDIERLKQGDILESTFAEFASRSRVLYKPLIEERDHYMALRLEQERRRHQPKNVLVVLGAGHLDGVTGLLEAPAPAQPEAELTRLETVPPTARWIRALPWVVVAVIIGGFIAGFMRSTELGMQMVVDWVLINGTLSAAGAAAALAHPLTVIAAFIAAPLTSLNPTIGAGLVVATVELTLRRPYVRDFSRLRKDVAHITGWWRNRVSRVLLVFLFATLGSAAGTYIAGFRIFERLVS